MINIVFLLALWQADDPIQNLRDTDPDVRAAAATIIGRKGIKSAVPYLIGLLRTEPVERVRSEAIEALERLTGIKGYGADYKKWNDWWNQDGSKSFPVSNLSRQQLQEILNPKFEEFKAAIEDTRKDVVKEAEKGKTEIRMLSFFVAGVAIFFVVIMIYFVGHVSSRLKEWKELIRQAEVYVKKSEEITGRTDKVLEELESKKTEILEFVKKRREEAQAEIERYADLQQENTEHRMREEVMSLRQKAEKELGQTLGDLRTQVDHELRRAAGNQREILEKEFKEQHARFLQEVQAHTLFLEASFLTIHGKQDDALRQYKKLVGLKPDHHVAWTNLGSVYRELMRYDEALEAYQRALALSPNDSNILYNVAATFARLKKRDKMLESLSRAISSDGEYKDEALNDAAFREYWNDPAFKDLAEA